MRVMIACDGSDASRQALNSVADRPWPANSEFLIVSIAEPVMTDLGGWVTDERKSLGESLVGEAVKFLKEFLPAYKIEGIVAEGFAKDEIVRLSKEWLADLIVIGSHGRTGFEHFLLGSVAEAVVHKSKCSVEIIKADPRKRQSLSESGKVGERVS